MRIHCDVCGVEIEKEDAFLRESDEGEPIWFCSTECLAEKGYHETMQDPGPEESTAPPDPR